MLHTHPKRILYIADFSLGEGGTDWQRMKVMEELGHKVVSLHAQSELSRKIDLLLPMRILRKLTHIEVDWVSLPERVYSMCRQYTFDAMWIDRGVTIPESVFKIFRKRFPEAKIIGYSPDDMMNPRNQSRAFRSSLPLYDLFFTTKFYGVEELKALGCPNVQFIPNAYSRIVHRPMPLTDKEKEHFGGPVVFIGAWEKERSRSICYLGDHGIPVKIWGGGKWLSLRNPPPSLNIQTQGAFADDYARVLTASDISLCFLRKVNRDLQTTRTMEIPACGSFMLAERTDEHMALFEEGKEAEFFSSNRELLEKVRYYLAHPEERRSIAEAGRQKCISAGYSNFARMEEMLRIALG